MSGVVPGTDNPRGAWSEEFRTLDDGWASMLTGPDGVTRSDGRPGTRMRRFVTTWEKVAGPGSPASPALPEGRADGREALALAAVLKTMAHWRRGTDVQLHGAGDGRAVAGRHLRGHGRLPGWRLGHLGRPRACCRGTGGEAMSGKDGLALPEGWKPNPEWFYDPNPRKPAAPVKSEPGQPGKSGGYRSGLTAARGSDVTPAAPPAVPVVHPEPASESSDSVADLVADTTRSGDRPLDPELERYCEVMHDAYEAAAVGAGWETQAASRKPWAEVPEANKATMRVAVAAAVAAVRADTADQILALPNATGAYWAGLKDAAAIVRGGTDGD